MCRNSVGATKNQLHQVGSYAPAQWVLAQAPPVCLRQHSQTHHTRASRKPIVREMSMRLWQCVGEHAWIACRQARLQDVVEQRLDKCHDNPRVKSAEGVAKQWLTTPRRCILDEAEWLTAPPRAMGTSR